MRRNNAGYGAKIGATAIIWSLATGIMAICIPLVRISESGVILPLIVMVGVSISTVAVWLSGDRAAKSGEELQKIERRIKDLETISLEKD